MELTVSTDETMEVMDVTARAEDAVPPGVDAGTCTAFVPHTTAGLVVNEAEPGLVAHLEAALDRLVPGTAGYRHDEVDDNAAAHLRATLVG